MSFGGNSSSKGRNVNEQFTTLWLTGGYDCTSNPRNLHVDLRVAGGIYAGKSLCVEGDLCGDVVTKSITAKNVDVGIDVIGNVYVDSLYTLFANESCLKYISVSNITEKEDGEGINVTSDINMGPDTIFNGETICVNGELQTNTITPKSGNSVVIEGDLLVNGNTNIGNIVVDLSDISADFIESNTICVNDSLLVNSVYPKTGDVVTVYGDLVGQEVDANLVDANILCVNVEVQTPSIVPKSGTEISIGGNIIPSANIAFNIGSSTNRWDNVYANTMYMSFIDGLSPITAKTDFLPSEDLAWNLGVFSQRWNTLCVGDIDNANIFNGNVILGNNVTSTNNITGNIIIGGVVITDEINGMGDGVLIEGVLALSSTLLANSMTANIMTSNVVCLDTLKPRTGNTITIDGDIMLLDSANITVDAINANIVCVDDEILVDTIKPKTGNVVTIYGDLFLTGNSNISGNIDMDLDNLIANVITANIINSDIVNSNVFTTTTLTSDLLTGNLIIGNVVCVNDELLTNTIKPKSGNVITIEGDLFLTGNTNIGNIVMNFDNLTANVITANIINSDIINSNVFTTDTLIGNMLIGESLTGNLIIGNVVCINDDLLTNTIKPKSGNVVTIEGDLFLTGNTNIVMNFDNLTANVITANIINSDVINSNVFTTDTLFGDTLIGESLTGNLITGNVFCVNDELLTNTIKPKSGNVVTIEGDLFLTGNTNIGNIVMNFDNLTANIITANIINSDVINSNVFTTDTLIGESLIGNSIIGNVLCVNNELLTNTIKPKSGDIVTIDGDLFLTGNTNIGNINMNLEFLEANVVCVNESLLVNNIEPKSGNTITANVQLFEAQIISATTSFDYKRTLVTSPIYNIKPDDDIISVLYTTTGNVQLYLPKITTLPFNRKKYSIVDEGGMSGINSITIFANISDQVMGGMTTEITGNYNSLQLYSNELDHWFYH